MTPTARNIIRNVMLFSPYYHTVNSTHDIFDIYYANKNISILSDATKGSSLALHGYCLFLGVTRHIIGASPHARLRVTYRSGPQFLRTA